jgi:hypothetical protein
LLVEADKDEAGEGLIEISKDPGRYGENCMARAK